MFLVIICQFLVQAPLSSIPQMSLNSTRGPMSHSLILPRVMSNFADISHTLVLTAPFNYSTSISNRGEIFRSTLFSSTPSALLTLVLTLSSVATSTSLNHPTTPLPPPPTSLLLLLLKHGPFSKKNSMSLNPSMKLIPSITSQATPPLLTPGLLA